MQKIKIRIFLEGPKSFQERFFMFKAILFDFDGTLADTGQILY